MSDHDGIDGRQDPADQTVSDAESRDLQIADEGPVKSGRCVVRYYPITSGPVDRSKLLAKLAELMAEDDP